MSFVVKRGKPGWAFALLPFTLFVLSSCALPTAPQAPPSNKAGGFEFYVEPQAEVVTLQGPTDGEQQLQPQKTPSDTRILIPDVDIGLEDYTFQFVSAEKLIVRFRVKNLTQTNLEQPFFFTLSSKSKNLVNAAAPLVTDQQLGGDGVLSPGERSARFRFDVTFKKNKPFTFLVSTSAFAGGKATCTNPVTFPDAELTAAVRIALAKPSGNITCADMASLTSFRSTEGSIVNLEGLQFAVNLTDLVLYKQAISNLTPLKGLTNLTTLELGSNDINDLTSLQGLTNLKTLDLYSNNISNLNPLQGLTSLSYLDLHNNNISDLSLLQGLTNLKTLNLGNTNISDLNPLQGLTKLAKLTLSENSISDLISLQGLTNLTSLDLGSNNISNLSPLQGLTNLGFLNLFSNNINDLTPLRGLTKVEGLGLGKNNISDLTPLQGLTNLNLLGLNDNNISDISALVANSGLDGVVGSIAGNLVFLSRNPLSPQALLDVETLRKRGVKVTIE